MEFLLFLIIIIVMAVFIFINVKINNFRARAEQQILKNTGISNSDFQANIDEGMEKKYLQHFLEEYPVYTEESIKELLKQYAINLLHKNTITEFSQAVCEKMQKDSKLDKIRDMEFKRASINHYKDSKLTGKIVFTDNRDEYEIVLNCMILENGIQIHDYMIFKGAIVGF